MEFENQDKIQKKTEEKQVEISKLQRRFEILMAESNSILGIIDSDGTIKEISEAITRITGYKPDELINKKVYNLFIGESLQKVMEMVNFCLVNKGKKVKGCVSLKTKDGMIVYFETIMQNLLYEPSIEGIAVSFRDITRRIQMQKRMAHISTHDELTGLPNRVFFNSKLVNQYRFYKEKKEKFAIMMLDISGLKHVNYSLGYQFGDKLIVEIVHRLKNILGEDNFLSRYAGDHFAIILPNLESYEEYINIIKAIIDLFSKPFKIEEYTLDISTNIGIRRCDDDVQDIDSLRKQAKVALLMAKREGKNTYRFYSSDLDAKNYKEFTLRDDLHYAIERQQLKIYYQPIINLKNDEILAAEALIRWEHPEWGIVPSDEFISLVEETGLITDIGKWAFKKVCEDYKRWVYKGLPSIKVSVNFYGAQFLESNFVKNIKDTIAAYKLKHEFLIVEISKTTLSKNINKLKSDIEGLQSLGIEVALDDLGTGFSSLSILSDLNFDIFKINDSFIKNIPTDSISNAITKYIINMAKELKIKLVAEGVENWDQGLYLKNLNCTAVQGLLYSEPIPLEDFEKNLAKKKWKPKVFKSTMILPQEDRRKFFRIRFNQLLEADMTILEIRGKKLDIGNTKVLIKNMGPGGLCFISNVRFPAERGITLQFTTELLEEELKVYGCIVWAEEKKNNLYEYGVEFTIDENGRSDLIKELNKVQIKMRNNILFAEGSFISDSYIQYFKKHSSL